MGNNDALSTQNPTLKPPQWILHSLLILHGRTCPVFFSYTENNKLKIKVFLYTIFFSDFLRFNTSNAAAAAYRLQVRVCVVAVEAVRAQTHTFTSQSPQGSIDPCCCFATLFPSTELPVNMSVVEVVGDCWTTIKPTFSPCDCADPQHGHSKSFFLMTCANLLLWTNMDFVLYKINI